MGLWRWCGGRAVACRGWGPLRGCVVRMGRSRYGAAQGEVEKLGRRVLGAMAAE